MEKVSQGSLEDEKEENARQEEKEKTDARKKRLGVSRVNSSIKRFYTNCFLQQLMQNTADQGARIEWGYSVSKSKISSLLSELNDFAEEKYVAKDFNHTIYFNNLEHELPFGLSMRARRYSSYTLPHSFKLRPYGKWLFETKYSEGDGSSIKEREELSLGESLSVAKCNPCNLTLTLPLAPHTADSYNRVQFEAKADNSIRITVDRNTEFFWLRNGLNGNSIGKENKARIEIKMPLDKIDSEATHSLLELLSDNGAMIEIGKKYAGYKKLGKYLREAAKMPVEESDTEIEAKLSLNRKDQFIFHRIKYDFYNGVFSGFNVSGRLPWTLESSAVHVYDFNEAGRVLRTSMKRTTTKSGEQIMNDDFGLGCILKRTEIKEKSGRSSDATDLLRSISNTIIKRRKYFIVEDSNGSTYCVSMDDSSNMRRHLFQIEVERTLLSPSKKEEDAAVDGIGRITNGILKRYPHLKPTTLTKAKWLSSIKNGA